MDVSDLYNEKKIDPIKDGECQWCGEATRINLKRKYLTPEDMLGRLLDHEACIVNKKWWLDEKDPLKDTWSFSALCNDVFMWGAADCERFSYDDIEDLYDAWVKDPTWGVSKWCIRKRGVRPQKPVELAIRESGRWDSWMDELPERV